MFGEMHKVYKGLWAFILYSAFGMLIAGQAGSDHAVVQWSSEMLTPV